MPKKPAAPFTAKENETIRRMFHEGKTDKEISLALSSYRHETLIGYHRRNFLNLTHARGASNSRSLQKNWERLFKAKHEFYEEEGCFKPIKEYEENGKKVTVYPQGYAYGAEHYNSELELNYL